jgi:hypothetical protein
VSGVAVRCFAEVAGRHAVGGAKHPVEGGEAFEAAGKGDFRDRALGASASNLRLSSRRIAITVCEKLIALSSNSACTCRIETPSWLAINAGDKCGSDSCEAIRRRANDRARW